MGHSGKKGEHEDSRAWRKYKGSSERVRSGTWKKGGRSNSKENKKQPKKRPDGIILIELAGNIRRRTCERGKTQEDIHWKRGGKRTKKTGPAGRRKKNVGGLFNLPNFKKE